MELKVQSALDTTENASAAGSTPAEVEQAEAVAMPQEPIAESQGMDADGETGDAQPEEMGSFRDALREQIHEEEEVSQGTNISLTKIMAGDFFAAQILRRQIWLIVIITFFAIIYISNRYSYQQKLIEKDKLQTELQDAMYKALSTSSQLTEKSRQSNVLDMLKSINDEDLHIADQPPYIIDVKE